MESWLLGIVRSQQRTVGIPQEIASAVSRNSIAALCCVFLRYSQVYLTATAPNWVTDETKLTAQDYVDIVAPQAENTAGAIDNWIEAIFVCVLQH
jgi:hypothetical protein